jgi:hypothetical protein
MNDGCAEESVKTSLKIVEPETVEVTESTRGKPGTPKDTGNPRDNHVDVGTTEHEAGNRSKLVPTAERGADENHVGTTLLTAGGTSRPLRMLVDTGAEISMLKRGLIPGNVAIHTDRQYEIAGIKVGSIKILEIVHVMLRDHNFQVAPWEIQLTEDRLIGRDIRKY